ncbi:MAG: glycosyltransferase family 39 protein [Desulfobacteraceae bacterium]
MEARNFVTAREIVKNNTWLVPTLNGEPRIAKPPLPTWITAAVYLLGGQEDNEGILRIPAALMGLGLVAALYGLVQCINKNGHLALVSATLAATSLLIMDMGRCGSWDIYSHSFMLSAIWSLTWGWQKDSITYFPFLIAGILMACSFMSKGPVAFFTLLLPFVIAYGVTFGTTPMIQQTKPMIYAAILTIILGGLWPALIYLKMPELSSTIATTETSSWLSRHQRHLFFYAQFPIYTGIWTIMVITAIFFPFARRRINQVENYRFIILWGIISILLLSIIPEKKDRYLLPAMVPFTILAGHLCYSLMLSATKNTLRVADLRLLYTHCIVTIAAALTGSTILFFFVTENTLLSKLVTTIYGIAFIAIAVFCVYAIRRKDILKIFVLSIPLISLINLILLPSIYQLLKISYAPAMKPLKEIRQIKDIEDLPFFFLPFVDPKELNAKRIWEAGKTITIWDYQKTPLPTNNQPFVLLSQKAPLQMLPQKTGGIFSVISLGKFHYDPKDTAKVLHLSLMSIRK